VTVVPPTWNEAGFLGDLSDALETFDRGRAADLCEALVAGLERGAEPTPGGAKAALQGLRRKCYFDLMERLAEALRRYDLGGNAVRRMHAQALIDQGRCPHAIDVLEALAARTADDPAENAEARGLLGRAYKQLYVDALARDPAAAALRLSRLTLQRAVDAYHGVWLEAPSERLWHGINTVALVFRARRDGVPLEPEPDAEAIARAVLASVRSRRERGTIAHWDMATAAEACVALGDAVQALTWTGEYVLQPQADAFELSSTERQLREVWGLAIDASPGSLLLPLLQAHILARSGGQVRIDRGALGATLYETGARASDQALEKVLGSEGVVTLQWYQQGLERCRMVAQVRNDLGEALGSGFLMRGRDLVAALGDEFVLLTNAHVVSDDPAVQARTGALAPDEAVIGFEALEAAAGRSFRASALLWTSPPEALDATLLRLDPPVTGVGAYPVSRTLPLADGRQKAYVIGHPGGRALSLSLQDNVVIDHDERLIHYRTPTEPGSSGSPVFNQQWKLIGLHHAGSLDMPRLKGVPGTYPANEGIWIQKIIAELAAAGVGGPVTAPGGGASTSGDCT